MLGLIMVDRLGPNGIAVVGTSMHTRGEVTPSVRIWVVKIGEPLPIEECHSRPFRTGLLSKVLSERGHEVTWWTSSFFHQEKRQLFLHDTMVRMTPHFNVMALYSPGYTSNISLSRVSDHRTVARKFRELAGKAEHRPDLIVCAFPTIQLTCAAVSFGRLMGIPIVVDVRDLWPDVFLHVLPEKLRWLGAIPARAIRGKVGHALRMATALTAMSNGCLAWGLRHAGRNRTSWDAVFPLGYPDISVDDKSLADASALMRSKGVDTSKTICWFLGMFGKHYDIPTVIRVASELRSRQCSSVQFVLSGDGPEIGKWRSMASGLGNVIFTGRIGPAEISYMSEVSAIALLAGDSVPESLPNKLFEYLAAGLPIVSSLAGETEAFIKDAGCGFCYSPKDPAGLLAALEPLISDPELRHTMGTRSRRVFETGYSADVVYEKMASHLERIVSEYRCGQQG